MQTICQRLLLFDGFVYTDAMRRFERSRKDAVVWILIVSAVLFSGAHSVQGARAGAPIVITGAQLPWGRVLPHDIVAFVHDNDWHQIPIQIDERDIREFSQIYGAGYRGNPNIGVFGIGATEEVYCDPNTFTGADLDPTLDANDELVFMMQDAGIRATTDERPPATQQGSGVEIEILDPLTQKMVYVYLFLQDGSLDPSSGTSYVDYDFHLLSGDYKMTYNTAGNDEQTGLRNDDRGEQLNPEDSVIRTAVYERHWSYRWTCDSLSLFGGPSLVEREDYWIAPGACGRHMGTFNAQEGAFIANISGPVRAIRSYLGANSGPLVQVDRIYYQAREDVAIYVRVHPRPSVGMFYVDHTLAAIGMTYANDLNPHGALIDGKPDHLTLGPISWELVSGEPGSIVRLHDTKTDIAFDTDDFTLFYVDEVDTDLTLCEACVEGCPQPQRLGDRNLIGASGVWNTAPLPNTDPALLATQTLTTRITMYYGDSTWTTTDAADRRLWSDAPVEIQITTWPESGSQSL